MLYDIVNMEYYKLLNKKKIKETDSQEEEGIHEKEISIYLF